MKKKYADFLLSRMHDVPRSPQCNQSAEITRYVAITHDQNHLTGDAVPIIKHITKDTTIGEIVSWYYQHNKDGFPLYDLRISQAT